MNGNKKTYAEKLKDPRWQKLRLQILERDKWTCKHCGATDKTLHVHHVHYIKGAEPWEYDEDKHLLETLCCDCHEQETADLPVAKDYLISQLAFHGMANAKWLGRFGDAMGWADMESDDDRELFLYVISTVILSREEFKKHGANESGYLWGKIVAGNFRPWEGSAE